MTERVDAERELERLREGVRERGHLVGRDPEGRDNAVDLALMLADEAEEKWAQTDERAVPAGGDTPSAASLDRAREQVLRSLVIELETVGLWRASVQSVCARAGVSKTTFYELFRNLPHAVERAALGGWLPEEFRAGMPALDVRGWTVRRRRGDDGYSEAVVAFVTESNRIEGIYRDPTPDEVQAHLRLLARDKLSVRAIEEFVRTVAGARLRNRPGLNVRVGGHVPPPGGPEIETRLKDLLARINTRELSPFPAHVEYELLHPFTDGNGRSGRAIWLWQMEHDIASDPFVRPFLHTWYYQSLSAARGAR